MIRELARKYADGGPGVQHNPSHPADSQTRLNPCLLPETSPLPTATLTNADGLLSLYLYTTPRNVSVALLCGLDVSAIGFLVLAYLLTAAT